jgi:DNA polymerase I-like protein with 3'-5' exonuclease and polymerase domains
MKKALILLDRHLRIEGWVKNKDYAFVANIHDEFQTEVVPDRAERFGHLAVRAIVKAGEDLGMRCPLDGEFKIGDNWAETH